MIKNEISYKNIQYLYKKSFVQNKKNMTQIFIKITYIVRILWKARTKFVTHKSIKNEHQNAKIHTCTHIRRNIKVRSLEKSCFFSQSRSTLTRGWARNKRHRRYKNPARVQKLYFYIFTTRRSFHGYCTFVCLYI